MGHFQRPPPADLAARLRRFIDYYQVLVLTKPLVAAWLIEWLEAFLTKHLD